MTFNIVKDYYISDQKFFFLEHFQIWILFFHLVSELKPPSLCLYNYLLEDLFTRKWVGWTKLQPALDDKTLNQPSYEQVEELSLNRFWKTKP